MGKAEEAAALLEAAEAAHGNGAGHEQILQGSREAVALFKELRDSRGTARALMVFIGQLLRTATGQPTEALEAVDEEMAAFQRAGDRRGEAMMKLALAEINMDRRGHEKREEALELAKDAKAVFIDLEDRTMEARATDMIASTLVKKCDGGGGPRCAKEATKYAREAFNMAQELGDRRAEARALYLLFSAKMYSEAPWKDGLKYAREAASIFKSIGAKWWQATVLRTVADWAQMKGQGSDGLPYAMESLAIYREVDQTSTKGWEASCLATLVGAHASGEGGATAAVKVAREGVELLKASGSKMAEAQALDIMCSAHLINEDTTEALRAAEEALARYRELGNQRLEAHLLHEIAQIHSLAGNQSEALTYLRESHAVSGELGDARSQARITVDIVMTHIRKKEYVTALEVGAEAIPLFQQCDDAEGEGVVLLNMASAHAAQEAFDGAVVEAEEARSLFQGLEFKDREAEALTFIADLHSRNEKHEKALQAATLAKSLYQKVGNTVAEAQALLMMAQSGISIADKDAGQTQKEEQRRVKKLYTAALKAAKEGLAIAKRLGDKDPRKVLLVDLFITVAQVQGILSKYKEAIKSVSEATRICLEVGYRPGECSAMIVLAQVHGWNGKRAEAKTAANKALEMARKLQDEYLEDVASWVLYQLEPQASGDSGPEERPAGTRGLAESSQAVDSGAGVGAAVPYTGPTAEALIPKVNELAMSLLATDELDQDTPLMDSGLDSLSMVQFRNTLQQQFPGVPMPASLIFDHPSVRAVSENIAEELKAAHSAGRPLV